MDETETDDRHEIAQAVPDMPVKPGGIEVLESYDDISKAELVRGFHAEDDGEPAAVQLLMLVGGHQVIALHLDLERQIWEVVFDEERDTDGNTTTDGYEDHHKPAIPHAREVLSDQAPDMVEQFGGRAIIPPSDEA